MKKVESKDKGDTGVAMVIADLTKLGYKVAIPISEHLPFDLVAISPEGELARVSVKYCGDKENAVIHLRTFSSNSKGCKMKRVNVNDVDGFAVYSPITNECYYVGRREAEGKRSQVGLRISDKMGDNNHPVLFAKDFRNPKVVFMEGKL